MGISPTITTSPLACSTSSSADASVTPADPRGLVGLHVDGHRRQLQQLAHPLRCRVPHQVTADVVGVVVGGQRAGQAHAVGGQHVEQPGDVVGRVDDHGLARSRGRRRGRRSSPSGGRSGRCGRCRGRPGADGSRGDRSCAHRRERRARPACHGTSTPRRYGEAVRSFTVVGSGRHRGLLRRPPAPGRLPGALPGPQRCRPRAAPRPAGRLARRRRRARGRRLRRPGRPCPPATSSSWPPRRPRSDQVAALAGQDWSTDDGTILVMQNGLGVEAPFHRAAAAARRCSAPCASCAPTRSGPGHIRPPRLRGGHPGRVPRRRPPAGVTPAVEAMVADLQTAGVTASPVPDLETGRWQKLVWNIPFNGLSVVLDADHRRADGRRVQPPAGRADHGRGGERGAAPAATASTSRSSTRC